jgi:hypothetical protein
MRLQLENHLPHIPRNIPSSRNQINLSREIPHQTHLSIMIHNITHPSKTHLNTTHILSQQATACNRALQSHQQQQHRPMVLPERTMPNTEGMAILMVLKTALHLIKIINRMRDTMPAFIPIQNKPKVVPRHLHILGIKKATRVAHTKSPAFQQRRHCLLQL